MLCSSLRAPGRVWVTFAVLAVGVVAFTLLQSLIIPVLTVIQAELGTDQTTVTWVLTAYLLSASVCTPLLGRIGDSLGKKKMLVVTLAALSIGSLIAALAPSIEVLILARVIQGAGGGVLPLSFGVIRDEFPDATRGRALSVVASLGAVGFAVGIVLGGPIVGGLGYVWLFLLPMIVTALAALAAALLVPESPVRTPGRIPLAPAVLLSAWLVAVLLAVSEGNVWGWTSGPVLGLLGLGGVLVWAWIRLERRAAVPLIDLTMMRRRGIWTANVVAAATGFGMFSAFAFLPQFLQTPPETGYGLGSTVTESGRLLLPSALGSFAVGLITASLILRFGARTVIVAGALLNALAFASIAVFHDAIWQLYVATVVQGVGGGLLFSSLANVVIASVPAEQSGVASGMNANIRTIGGSIGSAVMAGVVTARTGPTGLPVEQGYTIGFAMLAVGMLLATVAALWIPSIERAATGRDAIADGDSAVLASVPGGRRPEPDGSSTPPRPGGHPVRSDS